MLVRGGLTGILRDRLRLGVGFTWVAGWRGNGVTACVINSVGGHLAHRLVRDGGASAEEQSNELKKKKTALP